jgi:hypothetical protein
MKIVRPFIFRLAFSSGLLLTACSLPSWDYQVTQKAPQGVFTGNKCRVRVEPIVFDPHAKWGGLSETDFIATLRPEAQKSHAGDLTGVTDAYFERMRLDERDYIGDRGMLTTKQDGDEPFAVQARVVEVNTNTGALFVVNDVYAMPERTKVAEFKVVAENAFGFGTGHGMRTATIPLAWATLGYFRDRFACNGPAAVVD